MRRLLSLLALALLGLTTLTGCPHPRHGVVRPAVVVPVPAPVVVPAPGPAHCPPGQAKKGRC